MAPRKHFEAPEFCRIPLLFSTLVAAQLIVLVIWLAPRDAPSWSAAQFLAASTMALWLALVSAVLLCKLREPLNRLPNVLGALCCWALPVLVVWLGSLMVQQVDSLLRFGPSLSSEVAASFAWRNTLIAAVFWAVLLRYFHVQAQWLHNERAQAQAAVEALQARIQPHFLFNSMNSIAGLIARDPKTAERAVEDLSDLFRAALGASEGLSTLAEELDLARRFLDIERLRLADRLQVDWQVDADVPLDYPLPRLVLQPLIENAIQHGIAPRAEGGQIRLRVSASTEQLRIELDNPLPRAGATLAPAARGNQHAISNIEQRLAYHFAESVRLERGVVQDRYHCRLLLRRPAQLQRGAGSPRSARK